MSCTIAGCARKRYARGYCNMHWQRDRIGLSMEPRPMRSAAGEGNTRPDGYHSVHRDGAKTYTHIAVAEKALGHPLPRGAEVHHVNGNPSDNRPENLVICPNSAYHKLLHQRERSINACGHADWRVCVYCKRYSPPATMRQHGPRSFCHRTCSFRSAP